MGVNSDGFFMERQKKVKNFIQYTAKSFSDISLKKSETIHREAVTVYPFSQEIKRRDDGGSDDRATNLHFLFAEFGKCG